MMRITNLVNRKTRLVYLIQCCTAAKGFSMSIYNLMPIITLPSYELPKFPRNAF